MSTLLVKCRNGEAWVIDEAESTLYFEDELEPVLAGGVVPFRHTCSRGHDLPVPGRPVRVTDLPRPQVTSHRYKP